MTMPATTSDLSLLIISHGSSVEPDSYEPVLACAERLRGRSEFAEVAVGFHKQSPTLDDGLTSLRGRQVAIVPYLASAGFFAARYIPQKLGIQAGFNEIVRCGDRRLVYTEPLGTHRRIVDLIQRVANHTLQQQMPDGSELRETALVVVGHGTPRHPASGESVHKCVKMIEKMGDMRCVLPAFVDEADPVCLPT